MFIFAFDERGNNRAFNPDQDEYFVYGGYGIRTSYKNQLIENWNRCKIGLCGTSKCELKWSHFFTNKGPNPLPQDKRNSTQQGAILYNFFGDKRIPDDSLFPINLVINKNHLIKNGYIVSSSGGLKLDVGRFYNVLFGIIATLLNDVNDRAKVIMFDSLSSDKENGLRTQSYEHIYQEYLKQNEKFRVLPKSIRFHDSQTEPLIQIADVISGPIYSAYQHNDTSLLSIFRRRYCPDNRQYLLRKLID